MDTSSLVNTITMYCPLCNKVHEVEERKRMTGLSHNANKQIGYIEHYYFCDNTESEFHTLKTLEGNLTAASLAFLYEDKKNEIT